VATERDEVYEAQHERLLEGLAASIREKGLAQTQVADIVRHARASRRTFYKHFPDKDSCFVELTQRLSLVLMEQVDEAIDREAPLATQIDQAIDTYVDILLNEPSLAATWANPGLGARVVVAQREGVSAIWASSRSRSSARTWSSAASSRRSSALSTATRTSATWPPRSRGS
jgi:AcrR family transcriptional regulator